MVRYLCSELGVALRLPQVGFTIYHLLIFGARAFLLGQQGNPSKSLLSLFFMICTICLRGGENASAPSITPKVDPSNIFRCKWRWGTMAACCHTRMSTIYSDVRDKIMIFSLLLVEWKKSVFDWNCEKIDCMHSFGGATPTGGRKRWNNRWRAMVTSFGRLSLKVGRYGILRTSGGSFLFWMWMVNIFSLGLWN